MSGWVGDLEVEGGQNRKGFSCVSRLVKARGRTCNFSPSSGQF